MNNQLQSDKISLTSEYKNSVKIFKKKLQAKMGGKTPVRRSVLVNIVRIKWLDIDEFKIHLQSKGMIQGYNVWTSHSEVVERKNSRKSHHRRHPEPLPVEQMVDFNAMLHDIADAIYEFYDTTNT